MSSLNNSLPATIAISLGANLPSPIGPPHKTLNAVRPKLEEEIHNWIYQDIERNAQKTKKYEDLRFRWSPLFGTEPLGGPPEQPDYINAVLVVDGRQLSELPPSKAAAFALLRRFLRLENFFGRDRTISQEKWGARSLDIDFLAWGGLHLQENELTLPHPRLIERSFVIVPLAAALTSDEKPPRIMPKDQNWLESFL